MTTASKECPNCRRKAGRQHTAAEAVLLAMRRLETHTGMQDFDHDEIVVQAWAVAPDIFGLRNREDQYPDSKRVSMELASGKPLMVGRMIEKTAEPRRYRLTDAGRLRALNLQPNPNSGGPGI